MTRAARCALAMLLSGIVAAAHAQAAPPAPFIREIAFAGNDTTRASTMLREIPLHVGDRADPGQVERSRQAIQDLALFQSVTAELQPAEGGVRLLFTVKEKFYFIPAPRADANSDKQYSYGVQLRWYNVLGLNHTLRLTVKEENRQEANRSTALDYEASYYAPYVYDRYGLDLSYSHTREPVELPVAYDELTQIARAVVLRSFPGDLPASQGWRLGAGLQWSAVDNQGAGAPPSGGQATSLVLNVAYTDRHYNLYSEEGQQWGAEWQGATDHAFSDYDSSTLVAHYDNSWYIGQTPHQSVAVFAEGGVHDGGAAGATTNAFELGGVGDLRGYPHSFVGGQSYYYGGIEALRPLGWDWLRGVVFFESGNAYPDGESFAVEKSYSDIGLGIRLRVKWFVRFELNAGYAYPLRKPADGSGGRFFATGRR